MESESKCPTCRKMMETTAKLPCRHVFCTTCVTIVEARALKGSQQPTCPLCLASFKAGTESEPHPNSDYHDALISKVDPNRVQVCDDCGECDAAFICKHGCGMLCEDCHSLHSKHRRKATHAIMTLLEAGTGSALNARECILHKLPIVAFCLDCWPMPDLCYKCLAYEMSKNQGHSHVGVDEIVYPLEADQAEELIGLKIAEIKEKTTLAEDELKRITLLQESELDKIDQFYKDIVHKASLLKMKLEETTKAFYLTRSNLVVEFIEKIGFSKNIILQSSEMIQEAKEIYQKDKLVSKLVKSVRFFMDAISKKIDPVPVITQSDEHRGLDLDSNEFIESEGAFLLQRTRKESNIPDVLKKESSGFDVKTFKHFKRYGATGCKPMEFSHPSGVAIHPKTGHIYVTDRGNHRVQVMTQDIKFVRVFGCKGSGSGQFGNPLGISISPNGLVAISELEGNRVQVFDASDKVVAMIELGQKKSKTCEFDGFLQPSFLCFDDEGGLYVANKGKNRVDKFNCKFDFECSFAQSSLGEEGITSPDGICFSSSGEVAVVGKYGGKINFYSKTGKFVKTMKIKNHFGGAAIATGPGDTIFVSDYGNYRIRVYDTKTLKMICSFESSGTQENGHFYGPYGMVFGLQQRLFVCEAKSSRIRVFSV